MRRSRGVFAAVVVRGPGLRVRAARAAKTLLVDANWATVGTANLDYRSLFLNDELNLIDEGGELNLTNPTAALMFTEERDGPLRWNSQSAPGGSLFTTFPKL